MTVRTDDEIDRLLGAIGSEWRSTLATSRDIDPRIFHDSRRRLADQVVRLAAFASLSAVAVTLVIALRSAAPSSVPAGTSAVGAANTASPSATAPLTRTEMPRTTPTPRVAPPTSPFEDLIVEVGDSVTASGNVIDWGDSQPMLCADLLWVAYDPGCPAGSAVRVLGVDVHSLPGSETEGGWVTTYVTVTGTWAEGGIEVSDVEVASEPGLAAPPEVPCDSPSDGWPGNGSPLENEAAWIRLKNAVDGRPDLYVGLWRAMFDPERGWGIEGAQVVGTVGDVTAESERLAKIYRFNLCVVRVAFSASDLDAVAQVIARTVRDDGVETAIDPAIDRLVVYTLAFDRATAEALSPYADRLVIRPVAEPS
jgi:hypothetical protein